MSTTSFTILAHHLVRLASLRYALALDRSALAHVHLHVDGEHARFIASDGRVLALLKIDLDNVDGEPGDALFDGALLAAACATLIRADHATALRVVIDREQREARLTRGTAVAVVALRDLAYPITAAFLARYTNARMLPSIATFAPSLLTAASRIAGNRKSTLMLWSVSPDEDLACCWDRDGETGETIARDAIAKLLTQPGWWSDGSLLLMVMPITRRADGPAPDIGAFLAPTQTVEAATSAA